MSFVVRADGAPEWAQDLPAGWRSDWLKWAVGFASTKPEDPEDCDEERLPYISNEDIESWTGKLLIEQPEPADKDGRLFQRGDVLFNKLRPYLAKVYLAEFDGISSGELLNLRASERVLPRFLFHLLSSSAFIDTINAESFGTKMPRADWETVGHQPLPLPDLDTQRRIAGFLDERTARIDALIGRKRALLDRLAEKRQALITRAVTQGLDPSAPMKDSGIGWLGRVPAHWEVLPLRRIIARIGTGRTPQAEFGDRFNIGTEPWFTPGDFGETLKLTESRKQLTREGLLSGYAAFFPANTVMFVGIGATLGKAAMAPVDCSANQQIHGLVPNARGNANFIAFYLHAFRLTVRETSFGNTLGIINQDRTKSLVLPVPPVDEQADIATCLEAREAEHWRTIEPVLGSGLISRTRRLPQARMRTGRCRRVGQSAWRSCASL